ncbi:MAG TPA: hypothetical protein VFQ44_04415 [Streptosporangiaceae bacterium]|nr:hypothetical protein [Streptosporangiaceae bacterium]
MSSAHERQAGTSGAAGYEQGQTQAQGQGQTPAQSRDRGYQASGRDYQPAGRDYPGGRDYQAAERHRGAVVGFTALGATLMLLGGLWMAAIAVAALYHGHVFNNPATYQFRWDVRSWGWTELGLGIVLFATGMCVFLGIAWARYVGAFLAGLSAIANFIFIPWQPAWSILMIALDAAIIWALLTPRRYAGEF